jgi:hypothetical protein
VGDPRHVVRRQGRARRRPAGVAGPRGRGRRLVIAAVDALCDRGDLDDGEWDALVRAAGEDGAVDLLLVCGWYHAISFVARALRLPLEPGTEPHAL